MMAYFCVINKQLECDGCMFCYALEENQTEESDDEEWQKEKPLGKATNQKHMLILINKEEKVNGNH